MNWLDSFISLLSPRAGLERAKYRTALDYVRSYNAAQDDRLNQFAISRGTAEQIDRPYRQRMMYQAQELERNSETAEAIVSAFVSNVVGTGITPQARAKAFRSATRNETINSALEDAWAEWALPENCDITGESDISELQAMALWRLIFDGECFVKKVLDPSASLGAIPFRLQFLEPWLCESVQTEYQGRPVVSGVELNAFGKPVAYWFRRLDVNGLYSLSDIERIPANQMIHLMVKRRTNQVRGVTWFANIMGRIKGLDEYMVAELYAAEMAAMVGLIIKSEGASAKGIGAGRVSRVGALPEGGSDRKQKMSPGMILDLLPGEEATTVTPGRNAGTAAEYARLVDRRIGAAKGLSYEAITHDGSQASYSSSRSSLLQDRKTYKPLQLFMMTHFLRPIWREFGYWAYVTGAIDAPDYLINRAAYLQVRWNAPGWEWVDPLKDVKAAREEVEAGLTTRSILCAERGVEFRDIVEGLADEAKLIESMGLKLNQDRPAKGAGTSAQANSAQDGNGSTSNVPAAAVPGADTKPAA